MPLALHSCLFFMWVLRYQHFKRWEVVGFFPISETKIIFTFPYKMVEARDEMDVWHILLLLLLLRVC